MRPTDPATEADINGLVNEARARAAEIPQEVADRENEADSHCGPYGNRTAADCADDYDCGLITRLADRISSFHIQLTALRERLEIPEPPFEAYDGIDCRNETIRNLEAQLVASNTELYTATGALQQIEKEYWKGAQRSRLYNIAHSSLSTKEGETTDSHNPTLTETGEDQRAELIRMAEYAQDIEIRLIATKAELARKEEDLRNIREFVEKRLREGVTNGDLAALVDIENFVRAALGE